ncbi:MAG: TonB-dependent receptor [Sphingomonas sp.]
MRAFSASDMAASLALGIGLSAPAVAQDLGAQDLGAPYVDAQDAARGDASASDAKGQTIIVTGRRVEQPGVDRIATDRVDTPQVITTITREELERRGVSNLNDALRNVPGLSLGAGETSFQGNNAVLRGFTTRNDLFVDNARDFGYYFRDTFNDATVEVLKGPSGILFGRGSTGGVIHRVTKAPLSANALTGQAQFGLDDTRRATIDANLADPFSAGLAVRLNAVAHRSGVAARDGALSRRWAVAPVVTAHIGSATLLSLGYVHQEERNRPDYGIPWYGGTPADPGVAVPVDRRRYYGFSNDRLNTNVNIATARVDHQLGKDTRLTAWLRYSNNSRDFRYSEAVLPAAVSRATPLETVSVGRTLFEGSSRDRFLQGQADLATRLTIGGVRHELDVGWDIAEEAGDPVYVTNLNVPGTSLTNPTNPNYDSPANRFIRLRARTRSLAAGAFLIDTISVGDRWRAVLGLRWDSFRTRYSSTRFAQSGAPDRLSAVDRTDRKLSYRGALIFKPAANGSLYLSYANSFNPSGEGVESLISSGRALTEANINLAPETSYSLELGSKWEIFGRRVLLGVSLFRIEKDNARVPSDILPGFNVLGGRQRVDGAEIELGGRPAPGWDVRAGYSFIDSRTLSSAPGGPVVGAPLTLAPRHSGFIAIAHDATKWLNLGVNFSGQSARLGQNTPTRYLSAPGYVLLDINARVTLTPHVAVLLVVNNLTGRLYYDQLHPFHVIPGAGRTGLATLKLAL